MEYKIKRTYEIVDTKPSILKTNIPIVDIVSYGMYFIGAPFYFLYRSLKTNEKFCDLFKKRKKESFNGGEINHAVFTTLEGKKVDIDTSTVVKTELNHFYKNEAYEKLNELISKKYQINIDNLSDNFLIKEKIEYFNKDYKGDLSESVLYSYPQFAYNIAKLLKINQK